MPASVRPAAIPSPGDLPLPGLLERIGVSFASPEALAATLPFSAGDATCGSETELLAVVAGRREEVDLPRAIEHSNYFANLLRRTAAGDASPRLRHDLERFLAANGENVWENSWVRFPRARLSPYAARVLAGDLLADKKNSAAGVRGDAGRFLVAAPDGTEELRLPISYLIKLALADVLASLDRLPPPQRLTGERLMGHFLNDNTSPETFSFHVVPLCPGRGMGREIARETAKRFLFSQLLVMYANESFGLAESGQRALVCFSPHPPVRQQELNTHISDAFYRELFMSPCLSGWDRGEEKFRYMQLCHQVLSRSQLNAVAKLKEAGIIVNNLVVLPSVSNVSLANNGSHVSLGSRRLTRGVADPVSGFAPRHEKYVGDLAIKMVEHFLPLFVGTYSAAPYRLAFTDFHPENALGFLPHEVDYTHLRMIWRRWRKKARLSVCGRPLTPFGPPWLDSLVSGTFRLSGDFVPDFRLINYLVSLMSTDRSPSLDGTPGNGVRLRKDLADLGVFDEQMALYQLYKQREQGVMGFSGFEGRHYSLFESLEEDMGQAVDLQNLVTLLAFRYLATGEVTHRQIPDTPFVESERRQIFFGAAIGLPTFYVRRGTGNLFLRRVIARLRRVRPSRRYPGYLRVEMDEYRRALLGLIVDDGADLVELLGLRDTMEDLQLRLELPDRHAAAGKLTRGILETVNARSPLAVEAREFNVGAERYYRETLRRRHLLEGFRFLEEECGRTAFDPAFRAGLSAVLGNEDALSFLQRAKREVLAERAPAALLSTLIGLVICTAERDAREAGEGE